MIEPAKELTKKYEEHKEGGKKSRKAVVYGRTIYPCKKDRILFPGKKCYEDRSKLFY